MKNLIFVLLVALTIAIAFMALQCDRTPEDNDEVLMEFCPDDPTVEWCQ